MGSGPPSHGLVLGGCLVEFHGSFKDGRSIYPTRHGRMDRPKSNESLGKDILADEIVTQFVTRTIRGNRHPMAVVTNCRQFMTYVVGDEGLEPPTSCV